MNSKIVLTSAIATVMLTACGGGGSGDANELANTDTITLKNAAVSALGGNFDGNAKAVGSVANRNSEVLVGTLGDVTIGGTDTLPQQVDTDELQIQENFQPLIASSLATTESPNSTTTRTGSTINIDPDEVELCADETLFSDLSPQELNDCELLMQDVTVELSATAEDAGVVTYRFQEEDVMRFGYGSTTEFSELDIGGLKTFLDRFFVVTGSEAMNDLPTAMAGSVRISATATNQTEGNEAGSIALDIIDPIQIAGSDEDGEFELSLDSGNMFTISADAGTGSGSLSFDVGAFSLMAPIDAGIGRFNLAGWTGSADINVGSEELVVRDFGLSRGPLSFSIDNTDVLRMTLGAFGFTVTEGTDLEPGEVIIDGNMDLSLVISNLNDFDVDTDLASAMFGIMMPGGTRVSLAGNGNTRIGGVGPLTASFSMTDVNNVQESETIMVNSGECFESLPGSSDFSSEQQIAPADACL